MNSKALAATISRMDPGIRSMVHELWAWYEDEFLDSLELLIPVLKRGADAADRRSGLRTFTVDSASTANICSAKWIRLVDVLAQRMRLGSNLTPMTVWPPDLPSVAERLRELLRAAFAEPPTSPDQLLQATVELQAGIFHALALASFDLVEMVRAERR